MRNIEIKQSSDIVLLIYATFSLSSDCTRTEKINAGGDKAMINIAYS
jgi:hypothetical protein